MDDSSFVDVGQGERSLKDHTFNLLFTESLLSFVEFQGVFGQILQHHQTLCLSLLKLDEFDDVRMVEAFEESGLLESNASMTFHDFDCDGGAGGMVMCSMD